jgi:hypothetical protein
MEVVPTEREAEDLAAKDREADDAPACVPPNECHAPSAIAA